MGESCEEGKCCSGGASECSSGCECCHEKFCEQDKMAIMMCLVKEAKMELIKEKVKKKLESAIGKKLDQIADLLVEAMMEHYKTEDEHSAKEQRLRERFDAIFDAE